MTFTELTRLFRSFSERARLVLSFIPINRELATCRTVLWLGIVPRVLNTRLMCIMTFPILQKIVLFFYFDDLFNVTNRFNTICFQKFWKFSKHGNKEKCKEKIQMTGIAKLDWNYCSYTVSGEVVVVVRGLAVVKTVK